MTNEARAVRSLVFVPAHDGDRILSIATRGMDAICLDLEDLTPLPHKQEARAIFRDVARRLVEMGVMVFARTNGLADGMARDDLVAIAGPEVHCVSIPKTNGAGDVVAFCELLDEAERRAGLAPGTVLVRPIIETALGVHHAFEIASASPRVAYMGGVSGGWWGDISSSLGYVPRADGRETFYLRSKVLVDVRAAGVPFPIGGGSIASTDLDDLRAYALENKHLGYDGLHCSSSADAIRVVNDVFTPSREEIEGWLQLLPALDQAERDGVTATEVDGMFLDLAGLVKVRRQLDLARRLGLLDEPR